MKYSELPKLLSLGSTAAAAGYIVLFQACGGEAAPSSPEDRYRSVSSAMLDGDEGAFDSKRDDAHPAEGGAPSSRISEGYHRVSRGVTEILLPDGSKSDRFDYDIDEKQATVNDTPVGSERFVVLNDRPSPGTGGTIENRRYRLIRRSIYFADRLDPAYDPAHYEQGMASLKEPDLPEYSIPRESQPALSFDEFLDLSKLTWPPRFNKRWVSRVLRRDVSPIAVSLVPLNPSGDPAEEFATGISYTAENNIVRLIHDIPAMKMVVVDLYASLEGSSEYDHIPDEDISNVGFDDIPTTKMVVVGPHAASGGSSEDDDIPDEDISNIRFDQTAFGPGHYGADP